MEWMACTLLPNNRTPCIFHARFCNPSQRLQEDIDGQLKSMAVLKEALAGAEGKIENLEQENRCLRGEVDNCSKSKLGS